MTDITKDYLDQKFEGLDKKIGTVVTLVDDLAVATKKGIDTVVTLVDDLAVATKKGFDDVDKNFDEVKSDIRALGGRVAVVEMKLDRALSRTVDKHEHWIRQIAEKVGVTLE